MPVCIHIGYHKTASSWLQRVIFPRHPEIEYWDFLSDHAWLKDIAWTHDFDFDARQFRSQHLSNGQLDPARHVVISWENFVGDPLGGARDSQRIAERLHALFPDARVVIFIRHQLDMLDSLYRQFIHEGGACSLVQFLDLRPPSPVYFSAEYLRYDRLIAYYRQLFGADSVLVNLYEELKENPQALLDRLFTFIGVKPFRFEPDVLGQQVNRGMSSDALRLARFANRFLYSHYNPTPLIPKSWATARNLRDRLQNRPHPANSAPRRCVTPDVAAQFQEQFKATNRALRDQLGLPVEKYDYPL